MILTTAFAPANISCIFTIEKGKTPRTTGSTGIGFTINTGVNIVAQESKKTEIFFNEKLIDFPTVMSVIKSLTKKTIKISITSKLMLGCGFGLSGASSLATAYAVNNLLRLDNSPLDLAKAASVAEVKNGTGLGDVVNQYFGGIILKTEPSYKFKVQNLHLENTSIYCKVFSKIDTKSVIQNTKQIEKINKAGNNAIKIIEQKKENIAFKEIIQLSKQFAKESGLLKDQDVINTIENIESKGGYGSMIMLGNAVFADIPFEGSSRFTISSKNI